MTKQEFEAKVGSILEEIKKGNTFQAEVGIKTNYEILGDKFAVYQHLRTVNPSPYMYYMKFDSRELFGASPELVVSSRDGRVLSRQPVLVDMHRNDIARVCKPGTVKISRLMHLIKFSYVQHIVSNVVGVIRDDKDSFD